MSADKHKTSSAADPREFIISRLFDAPRELVWQAWTDPRRMARWWGPHHFANPVCELDPRPGGSWRIVMRGADGVDFPAKGVYHEVVKPERIVMTMDHSELPDEWHDRVNPNRDRRAGRPKVEALATITFEAVPDRPPKTRLTICVRLESAAIRDSLFKIGMNEGWSQSLDQLGQELDRKDV